VPFLPPRGSDAAERGWRDGLELAGAAHGFTISPGGVASACTLASLRCRKRAVTPPPLLFFLAAGILLAACTFFGFCLQRDARRILCACLGMETCKAR